MRLINFYRYMFRHRRALLLAVISLFIHSLILLAMPWFLRLLVNSVFTADNPAKLNLYSLIVLAFMPLYGLAGYGQSCLLNYLNDRMIADLRKDVFQHLLKLPLGFYSQHRLGAIISRVTSDIMFLQGTVMMSTVHLLHQVVLIIGGIILMLMLDWKFTLIMLVLFPLALPLTLIFSKKLRSLATAVQDRSARLTTVIEETLAGIKEIKAYTQEKYEQERFAETIEARFSAMFRQTMNRSLFDSLMATLTTAGLIILIWFGGYQTILGRLMPGDLIAILFYMGIVIGPIRNSAKSYSRIQEAIGASQRVYEILHAETEQDEADAVDDLVFKGRVRFDQVYYQYPEAAEMTLKNLSFTAEPGMLVAIVGRNGAGKTTLARLIPRFYDPGQGNIEIDDRPVSQIKLSCLRRQIGVVSQETYLFGGTIAENIAYSCPGIAEEHLVKAAKSAWAHDFIMKTPQQYQTVIGDRGVKLSAGQRQRIALARLFLRDCRIVILDEGKSSLDVESAQALNQAIDELLKGRTAFVITHDFSSLEKADLILVLDEGEIVEQGTYSQLLAKNGLFKTFCEMGKKLTI